MKLKTRRILFCICLIIFLISSPLIILYAFGFRYDFSQKKITQTGIIYLTPNIHDDIKILINDKEELDRISIKGIFKKDFVLHNLIPKTYNIKVDKKNYHRWEKNLVVLPGLITYARPLLLPISPEKKIIFSDIGISAWSISDKFKKVFFLKNFNEKISANIYDFSKKTFSSLNIDSSGSRSISANGSFPDHEIFLAPNGEKFGVSLPEINNKIILLNINGENISISANITPQNKIINGQWDDTSRYFLYLNNKGDLNSYDITNKSANKILENVLGFRLNGENIYYLSNNNLFLYRTSIYNPLDQEQLSYGPLSSVINNVKTDQFGKITIEQKAEIIISSQNAIAVISPDKNLYVIGKNGMPANIKNNIDAAEFSLNGENLVFNSQFEIFTYDLASGQESLITRLSQKVSNVSWYSDQNHVWFLANQTIKNIELDSRPTPNIIDFISIPAQPSSILYADSNAIYYDQKKDNILSLYQIEMPN